MPLHRVAYGPLKDFLAIASQSIKVRLEVIHTRSLSQNPVHNRHAAKAVKMLSLNLVHFSTLKVVLFFLSQNLAQKQYT